MSMGKLRTTAWLLASVASPVAGQAHGAEPIEIPLRVEQGRLTVPVEAADGTELRFVVSTGNGSTVFSESTAARLGEHPALTVGGVPVLTDDVHTTPDESLTAAGKGADGMIGSNTLNQFDVLIDVPGGRLVLKPIGRAVEWEGMTLSNPVRLRVYHGLMMGLDVELNGRAYQAMLDVGTPALVVNEPVRGHLSIDAEDVGTLALGSLTLADLPVWVRDLPLFAAWDPNGNGFVVVGAAIAYDCAISLSWVHREVRTCVR